MENKNLKKITKKELLEILLSQAKRIDELEQELNKTKSKLESKKVTIEESGSIAEATLKLNNIFENAEETAKQYLFNIKEKCKKIENETKKACQIEKENMFKETEELCQQKKKEADEYLAQIEKKVKELNKLYEKENNKKTSKNKNNSSKKKNPTKSKTENLSKNSIPEDIKTNNTKEIIKNKVIVEKSKKAIKGRPVRTVKKREVSV